MLKIVLEDNVFVTETADVVDTKIHIEVDDYCFPSDNWTDFTFPVLEWWKNNLVQIKHSDNCTFRLMFHDGPFWMDGFKDKNMGLKIEFVNDRRHRRTEFVTYCSYKELVEELYRAFKTFAKILYNNNLAQGAFEGIYQQTLLSISELKMFLKKI